MIWASRLRVAVRWFWPLDLAILACNTVARATTWWLLAGNAQPQAREGNPLVAWLFATLGIAGVAIGTGLVGIVIVLTGQTFCVSQARLGKRIAFISTWTLLVLVAADAGWDVGQALYARTGG